MARILKSIGYLAVFGGGGFMLYLLSPSDEQVKQKMREKAGTHMYTTPEQVKRSKDFTAVLIASATSGKTIYGAKSAKEQRLHERAKEID